MSQLSNNGLSAESIVDLRESGLKPLDVAARPIGPAELAATSGQQVLGPNVDGYVIPYFDFDGKPIKYYRLKLLNAPPKMKYRQPTDSDNYIYFPPGLNDLLRTNPGFIIITEGEKKAACAVQMGFPCVAVAGVDSWRQRKLTFPDDIELKQLPNQKKLQAILPRGDSHGLVWQEAGNFAQGFTELMDFCSYNKLQVLICFDMDKGGVKPEVQRAAATLGYEIRYRGLPIRNIRQLDLPAERNQKIGLDDYLVNNGKEEFTNLISKCLAKRIAFPRHPNPKTHISRQLQRTRMSRKESQDVALSILMELEARGRRLQNEASEDVFYFDEQSHTLMPVFLNNKNVALHETVFGGYLYREFGIGSADMKIINWLASQFNGEVGIDRTATHKVIARPADMPDTVAYQLSDSHFVIITGDKSRPFMICENGTHGILFEQGQVLPLDHRKVEAQLSMNIEDEPEMKWLDVIKEFNFRRPTEMDNGKTTASEDQLQLLAGLLFYLSPWMLRWRGTQLPVELVIGEAGSGKSSLYQLRQTIITGEPKLSNMTNDIRDWYAGITSRGGLYVMDNVHFTSGAKDYRQRLSDEFCRLITEPIPHVEMRKLYTSNNVLRLPVSTTFAVTAIEQPFFNTDLIQRAAIFEVQAISKSHDSRWSQRHMESQGGRLGWLCHHLIVLHHFLNKVLYHNKMKPGYKSHHRLANYEQSLMVMADVFGIDGSWIPDALQVQTDIKMSENDWVIEGLTHFVAEWKEDREGGNIHEPFSISDVVSWAEEHENFSKNLTLTNSWKLGKYVRGKAQTIQNTVGIEEAGSKANKTMYAIKRPN